MPANNKLLITGIPNYGLSGPNLAVGSRGASTRERPPRPPLRRPTRRGSRRFRRLCLAGPYGTRPAVGSAGALRRRPHPFLRRLPAARLLGYWGEASRPPGGRHGRSGLPVGLAARDSAL